MDQINIKDILEKQLQRLDELSENAAKFYNAKQLTKLSKAMAGIVAAIQAMSDAADIADIADALDM